MGCGQESPSGLAIYKTYVKLAHRPQLISEWATERHLRAPAIEGVHMSDNTHAYYEYRAEKARILAAAATDPKIAAIHQEMAERYELLVRGGTNDDRDTASVSERSYAQL